ncbi:MAG TPA: preprotein translocase subunit YajC [Nocardioidaceae bacterium]|nr:preprotein translocase subunit YajC [Nocardioidaceae bacterium]
MNDLAGLLPLVLIFVLFWFLILRPARKKQQAVSALRSSLGVGDSVLLGSGLFARIVGVEDEGRELRLEIAPGVVVRAHRDAVVSKEQTADASSSDEDTPPAGGPGTGLDGDPGPRA